MNYLLVSDAHGDATVLQTLFNHYRDKTDAMFYAGDSELLANDAVFSGVQTVRGNMDFDPNFQEEIVYQDALTTIFMAHGHLYDTNYTLDYLLAAGEKQHANVIVTGHTHQLGVEWYGPTLVINPGSISAPRGEFRALGGTYAVLTVTESNIEVTFYNREMHAIPALSFKWQNEK